MAHSVVEILWTLLRKPGWLQRARRTEPSWPGEAEVAAWQAHRPDVREDGVHPSPSPFYVEWWYFDAIDQAGTTISVILHMTDLVRPAATTGSLNITLCSPGKPAVHRFFIYPRATIQAAAAGFDIRVGENSFYLEGDRCYCLKIHEADLQMELKFQPETLSWRPGNGKFEFGRPEAFFAWVVPQPKATVSGWIQTQGRRSPFEGIGYHDHNWGTVSLLDTVKQWSWGRIYLDDLTCIYADIHLSERYGGRRVMPFAVLDDRRVLISSFLDQHDPLDRQRDFLRSPLANSTPPGWVLGWKRGNETLQVELHTSEVLEHSDLLAGSVVRKWLIGRLIAHPAYIRCRSTAEATWADGVHTRALTGTAISEQLTLQR